MHKDTVAIHFAVAAVARLDAAQRRRVLQAAGIAPELLAQPKARLPAPAFAALWLAVAREIDDEFFGLDRRRMKVGSYALLSRALLGAGTLRRALPQMLRGLALFLDDIHGELAVQGADGGEARIGINNRIADSADRRFADETLLVMVHGLACWLVGRRIPLRAAEFGFARPAHAAEYTLMFSEHLRFGCECSALRFDARLLDLPLVQTPATLKPFLRDAPQSVFLKYKNPASWTARLRRRLRGCVGHDAWPTLEALAAEWQVAPTTLRRRLEAEGGSHQRVKDQLRLDLAIDLLSRTDTPAADIATQLGFADASAFHRAFKRWSGVQPGEYRARRVASPSVNTPDETEQ
jgi:AraC-like DNA-binding protein